MKNSFKCTPKTVVLLAVVALCSPYPLALAQNSQQSKASDDKDELEHITVNAQSGDAAMQAFNSGNFALAEIKFKENEKCAFRLERNSQAAIEAVQNAQLNQQLSGNASNTSSSITDSNASRVDAHFSEAYPIKKGRDGKAISRDVTCDNRAFQIYMAAMSQLQLGRTDEAEENFRRAVSMGQNLYDAHHRLALINLLRHDNEAAKEHLAAIKSMLRRCLTCDARDEILSRADFLQKALDGKVRLQ